MDDEGDEYSWKFAQAAYCDGVEKLQQGNLSEALTAFEHAIELRPDLPEVHSNLGAVLCELGHRDEAEEAYRRAIELRPDLPEVHTNLGNVLRELGRLDEAEDAHRRALALRPDFPEAHSNLGNVLRELGRRDEAEEAYRRMIALRPDDPMAHYNLGNVLSDLGRHDESEQAYRRALALRPDDPMAHYNLGYVLSDLGRHDESEQAYRRAIELRPDDPEAHNGLGNVLRDLGRLGEAEEAYRLTIELRPDFPWAQNGLGNVLRDLGRLDEAKEAYRRAIEVRPDFSGAYNGLGNVLRDLGRREDAEQSYRRAIELRPDYPEAHANLGHILETRLRHVEALGHFAAAVRHAPDDPRFSAAFISCVEAVSRYRNDEELLVALVEARTLDLILDFGAVAFLEQAFLRRPRPLPVVFRHGRAWGLPGIGLVRDLIRSLADTGFKKTPTAQTEAGHLARHRLLAAARDELMWAATAPGERRQWLEQFVGFGPRAAFACAAAGEPAQAVEHLERGLAVQLGLDVGLQLADLTPVIAAGRPDLAQRYEKALARRNQLWQAGGAGQERWLALRQARVELDAAVAGIRSVDRRFGLPMEWPRIAAVSAKLPLVYLAGSPERLLALLVVDGQAVMLPGVGAHGAAVVDKALRAWEAKYTANFQTVWQPAYPSVLGVLWRPLMGPVVQALQQRGIGRAALVATGGLARLPLHLSWHEQRGRRRYAMEEVELCQVPSARLLEGAQRWQKPTGQGGRVLAILDDRASNPHGHVLAGFAQAAELRLRELFGERLTVLKGAAASRRAVLAALPSAETVYVLGHGEGARGTVEDSQLHLASGEALTLSDVAGLHLAGQVWLMVACEGARTAEHQPDEGRAFTGGLLSSGASGVVAAPFVVDAKWAVPVSLAAMAGLAARHHPATALCAAQRAQAAGKLEPVGESTPAFGALTGAVAADTGEDNPGRWGFLYAGA